MMDGTNQKLDHSDEEDSQESSGETEKCFYASFKIYINSDDEKDEDSTSDNGEESTHTNSLKGTVVRIEKTEEVSEDDLTDDDEKTISNENLLDDKFDKENPENTDNEVDEIEPIIEKRKLSLEEKKERIKDERVQSPVFFLDPRDWVRSEGSSPLPFKQPKLLDSLETNLEVLSECEEMSGPSSWFTKEPDPKRPKRRPRSLHLMEREREGSVTPPLSCLRGYSATPPPLSRSSTPGPLLDRHRKVPIPVLCSRGALMAERLSASCGSPQSHFGPSPSFKRSMDVEALSLFNTNSRFTSPRPMRGARSLTMLGKVSSEDLRRFITSSQGNITTQGTPHTFSFLIVCFPIRGRDIIVYKGCISCLSRIILCDFRLYKTTFDNMVEFTIM